MRHLLTLVTLLTVSGLSVYAGAGSSDTPAAASTRKILKQKVTVDFKDTRLADVIDELKDQVKGLRMQIDTKGGVSRNITVTYQAKDQPLEEVLKGMFAKNGLSYEIISQKNNAYDGSIKIIKK